MIPGLIFTMVQVNRGEPIAAQRRFIENPVVKSLKPFKNMMRLNNTTLEQQVKGKYPLFLIRLEGTRMMLFEVNCFQ